jgi:sugar phosphate isomerase/epimerase
MQRKDLSQSLIIPAAMQAPSPQDNTQSKVLGVQLWTIRAYLEKDLLGSLTKLAKLGYTEVELFGYCGTYWRKSPKEFSKICADLGLTIISSHYFTGRHNRSFPGTLLNGWEKAVEDAALMNIPYMICAWLYNQERTSIDLYKELADLLNQAGQTCQQSAIELGYHGHDFEFPSIDGIVPYDLLLQSTDPELVKMEADLYWITKAGVDPVAYFKQYPGRFPLWHVKDMEPESQQFAEVGQGIIDFDRIFAHRHTAGLKHWFVEQDQMIREPFESLAISRDYLLKKNY